MLWRNCDLYEEARTPFAVHLALHKTQRTDPKAVGVAVFVWATLRVCCPLINTKERV
jgi:hypothetical protein